MTDDAPQFVDIYALPADQPGIARALLAAAADDPEVVRTVSAGFRVPAAIAEAAGFGAEDPDVVDSSIVSGSALDNTAVGSDRPIADVLTGSTPDSLPAKIDGGPRYLTDQRVAGAADLASLPVEVRAAAEDVPASDGPVGFEPAGAVQTGDGLEHTGVVPADAAIGDAASVDQSGDPVDAPEPADTPTDAPPAEPKLEGKELEAALVAAGLPLTGKADEKRARLAAHRAGL